MDKSSDLILREYSWKPLWLAYFWKDKPLWFLKAHNLVVGLQPEHGVLKVRHTVALLIHQHRKINLNVCLGEVVRQFVVIQNRLRNLQTVIIDRTIRVLCQAEFFCFHRYTVPEFGNSFNRLVQIGIGHGVVWCRGLMTEG